MVYTDENEPAPAPGPALLDALADQMFALANEMAGSRMVGGFVHDALYPS